MILIDAVYINDGGGKVLLDYLIRELENTDKIIHYLLDERVLDNIPAIKSSNTVEYIKPDFSLRKNFYRKNRNAFQTIICFGNLPPNIKTSAKVFTYFHQLLYLKVPKEMELKKKLLYWLKTTILNHIKNNTDFWILQSDLVRNGLAVKYNVPKEKILVLPFYPPFPETEEVPREKLKFLYVSNATPHKNHVKLLEAFCRFYDENQKGKLVVTVNDDYPEVLNAIKKIQDKNYPVENVGFVSRAELSKLYKSSEYLIFPSLSESFGLGLVEGIENGCKVIGADLPYTKAVCEPSLLFNPYSAEDIFKAFSLSLHTEIKPSVSKVKNNIREIIGLL